jgi:hypothetical protein
MNYLTAALAWAARTRSMSLSMVVRGDGLVGAGTGE